MSIKANKKHHMLLQTNNVPAAQLETIYAVRTLKEERKLGQYKLVDDGITRYFKNFKDLQYFSDKALHSKHKHVILVRGEVPE